MWHFLTWSGGSIRVRDLGGHQVVGMAGQVGSWGKAGWTGSWG